MGQAPVHSTLLLIMGLFAAGCFSGDERGAGHGDAAEDAAVGDGSAEIDGGRDAGGVQPPDAAADVVHNGTRFPPDPPVCTDGDHGEARAERVKATTVGLEESLTDRCDDDGNLIDHQCEILPSTDCEPCQGECPGCSEHTGRVIEVPFDCNGACIDGVCVSWCPDPGDSLTVTHDTAAGVLRVENLTKTRSYTCTPHADGEALCFDLDGYQSEVEYPFVMDCYGPESQPLRLPMDIAPQGSIMCFVDCTDITPP